MWPLVETIPWIPNGPYPYTSGWWSYRHLRFLDWKASPSCLLPFLRGSPQLPFLSSFGQSPNPKHSPLKYFYNMAFLHHLSLYFKPFNESYQPNDNITWPCLQSGPHPFPPYSCHTDQYPRPLCSHYWPGRPPTLKGDVCSHSTRTESAFGQWTITAF